jgi:formylglycine-generating enzyme required for sulfatase activity
VSDAFDPGRPSRTTLRPLARSRVPQALALVAGAIVITVAVGVARRGSDERARCGPGFVARGARCVVPSESACPSPLVATPLGCDAPDARVLVPETTLVLGPSDWEAEGRVAPRTVHAGPFRIDAFEVTRGRWAREWASDDAHAGSPSGASPGFDAARAASGISREGAAAFCARRAPGGRLPTEDEWIAAAVAGASAPPRYPWGDTGAVCRRGAWGLAAGPCADASDGPDTVGAHPDGYSALGIHDLAGNVAEWVAGESGGERESGEGNDEAGRGDAAQTGQASSAASGAGRSDARASASGAPGWAKGGSWQTALATELRIWARLEVAPGAHDPRVGFRCVYPA